MIKTLCPRVYIATTSFAKFSTEPLELLRSHGCEILWNTKGRKMTESEIQEALCSCDAVIAGTEVYSAKVLACASNLKTISRLGVGLDNIEMRCATERNVGVFRTQTTPACAVAELTVGLILDLLRKISFHHSLLVRGTWEKTMGSLFTGKTLGIIGLGVTGKRLVELTKGFELKYLANDINPDDSFAERNRVHFCSLDSLLADADVISIHLNLTEETFGLIDSRTLAKVKRKALLINTSRGEIVDESALIEALDAGIIGGAGLDVFCQEPYAGPLLNYDNIIATPHIGSYARELRIRMELEAAENVIKGLGL